MGECMVLVMSVGCGGDEAGADVMRYVVVLRVSFDTAIPAKASQPILKDTPA